MGKKLGRNEPCWCGSGLKFKHCHLNRPDQKPAPPWETEKALRGAFSKKVCSVPKEWTEECVGAPIRAHTVPKSGSLKQIARNGHVYGYTPSLQKLTKYKGKVPPELLGINSASTFTGFCSKHDTQLFAPLETEDFRSTFQQCFLLGYRAFAREVYKKKASAVLSPERRRADKGKSENAQFQIQLINSGYEIGLAGGLQDNARHLEEMQKCLISNEFDSVRAYVIQLAEPPPVMCSGGIFPERTFDGNRLHDLSDPTEKCDLMTISSFWDGTFGYVVLSWLSGSDSACIPFVKSLETISGEDLSAALLRLFFEYLENIFMQPEWWERLTEEQQEYLNRRMWSLVGHWEGTHECGNISDDGVCFKAWPVLSRQRIGDYGSKKAMQPTGEHPSG